VERLRVTRREGKVREGKGRNRREWERGRGMQSEKTRMAEARPQILDDVNALDSSEARSLFSVVIQVGAVQRRRIC